MPDSLLPFAARPVADGVYSMTAPLTVGNSAAEAVLMAYSIPANSLLVGSTYDVMLSGFGGTTAQTVTFRLRYGGLTGVLLCSWAIVCAATTSPQGFWLEASMTCRTTGATGTAYAQGVCLNEWSATLPNPVKLTENNAAAAVINTTVQNDLALTAQWTTAAVGATMTATNGRISLAKT